MNFTRTCSLRRELWPVILTAALVIGPTATTEFSIAQTAAVQSGSPNKLPNFEVVSIHQSTQDGSSWGCLPGGRITGVQTLAGLIDLAFIDEVRKEQIINLPKWGESDRYAISAIPPESSESSKIQYRTVYPSKEQQQMLQSLLIQRFNLRFHREFRNEQAYLVSLKANSDALKLQAPKDKHMPSYVSVHIDNVETGSFSLVVYNSSMSVFAREVSRYTGLNVIDHTNLTGSYDFRVPFYHNQNESGSDFGASVLTGLRDFGFNIKSLKMPVEHIVIDHVDRPSEN